MTIELLDRLQDRETERDANAAAAYHTLVVAITDDTSQHDEEAIAAILDAAGKSASDLSNDVSSYRRRRDQQATLRSHGDLAQRRRDAQAGIAAADAKLKLAQQVHRQETLPCRIELEETARQQVESLELRKQLLASCSDPALLGQQQALRREASMLGHHRDQQQRKVAELSNLLDHNRTLVNRRENAPGRLGLAEAVRIVERQSGELRTLQAEMTEIVGQLQENQRRQDELGEQMIQS